MTKNEKTDLIISGATAVVLIGLGLIAAKGVYDDLRAAGVIDKIKEDARELASKAAVNVGAKSPAEQQHLIDELINGPRANWTTGGGPK